MVADEPIEDDLEEAVGLVEPPPLPAKPSPPDSLDLHFTLAPEGAAHFAETVDRLSKTKSSLSEFRIVSLDRRDDAIARLGLSYGLRSVGAPGRQSAWRKFVAPLSKATPKKAGRVLKQMLQESGRILAVARVETQRRRWAWRLKDSRIEVVLDQSTVQVNGKQIALASASFSSREPSDEVFSLLADICKEETLRLGAESDLLRVFRLRGSSVPQHVSSLTPELSASMDAADGFRAIARASFDQFLLNESVIRATGDREAVHQCRVAMRRLSACFRVFSAFLTGADFDAIKLDFKELRALLRKARDLHVLLADVVTPAITVEPPAGGKMLIRELETQRDAAQGELAAFLESPRAAALFLRFRLWAETGDWSKDPDAECGRKRSQRLVKFGKRKLSKMNEDFLAAAARLGEMSDEERHHTRIAGKNLRYVAEFFHTLAEGDAGKERYRVFLRSLKELQGVLGDWNDILMARRFFDHFTEEAREDDEAQPASRNKRAALSAAKTLAARIAALPPTEFRDKSAKAYQALLETKPFWHKLS
jgi:CHAD domain-containing protein